MGTKFAVLFLWYHLAFILYALLNMIMSSVLYTAFSAAQKNKSISCPHFKRAGVVVKALSSQGLLA